MINGRRYKRLTVRPNKYGVVVLPDGWFAESIDEETGEGRGWTPCR